MHTTRTIHPSIQISYMVGLSYSSLDPTHGFALPPLPLSCCFPVVARVESLNVGDLCRLTDHVLQKLRALERWTCHCERTCVFFLLTFSTLQHISKSYTSTSSKYPRVTTQR